MALLRVNPTRMEYNKTKKRLRSSVRGHKLLKDKRDDLIKKLISLATRNKEMRETVEAKMAEVCSTTLPQSVFPAIFGDPRYRDHLHARRAMYKARAEKGAAILDSSPHLKVVQPKGAFYLVATFTPEFMGHGIDKPAFFV